MLKKIRYRLKTNCIVNSIPLIYSFPLNAIALRNNLNTGIKSSKSTAIFESSLIKIIRPPRKSLPVFMIKIWSGYLPMLYTNPESKKHFFSWIVHYVNDRVTLSNLVSTILLPNDLDITYFFMVILRLQI